ncbi:ankyrin repeat protein [Fusarium austroafricanum]|uniref:Ankyrin repeat protein n=1 Tax=Fusarium austroafricanum TaxID=2364996 RepID=A0A8H4KIA6_9HYPO|nr:ankyrin repeat protein [Fusarium austroafricanum]
MSRASTIQAIRWDQQKNIIRTLYLDQDKSPDEIAKFMKEQYGFSASRHQIIRRLAKWKFRKYTKKAEWVCADSKIQERREQEGKETELLTNGKTISTRKLQKALRRYIGPWNLGPECQRIAPSTDLTTLVVHTPKEDTDIGLHTTPWFMFWNRAEETGNLISQECMSILLKWIIDSNYLELVKLAVTLDGPTAQITASRLLPSAASMGEKDLLLSLLDAAGGISVACRDMSKALEVAIANVDAPMVDLLLKSGSNPNGPPSCHQGPLKQALELEDGEVIIEILLKAGVSFQDTAFCPSLLLHARNAVSARMLIDAGAQVNHTGTRFCSPIQKAANPNLSCYHSQDVSMRHAERRELPTLDGTFSAAVPPISTAAMNGNLEMVKRLLEAGAEINLFRKVKAQLGGMVDQIKERLGGLHEVDMCKYAFPHLQLSNQSPLQACISSLSVDLATKRKIAELLLQSDVDIHAPAVFWKGRTALQAAVEMDDYHMANLLMEYGVNVNEAPASYEGLTALQAASLNGSTELFRLLTRHGGDVHAPPAPTRGFTCLQAAATSGNLELISLLLQLGTKADENALEHHICCYGCNHPLESSASHANIGDIQPFVHTRVEVKYRGAASALYHAAYAQDYYLCGLLLREDTLADQESGPHPLIAAIFRSSHEIVSRLLDAKANPNTCSKLVHLGKTACYYSDVGMILLLLNNGAEFVEIKRCQYSPLEACIRRADFKLDILQFLLDHLSRNRTGLWLYDLFALADLAASRGLPLEAIRLLVSLDATIGVSKPKRFPFGVVEGYSNELYQVLITLYSEGFYQHEAEALAKVAKGKGEALYRAAKDGHMEMVQLLLGAGADINYCTKRSFDLTALQIACKEGHLHIAEYLISRGAETDLERGVKIPKVALVDATANGHYNIVVLLLEHGVPIDPVTSPFCLSLHARAAAAAGRLDIAYLLLENGNCLYSQNELHGIARYAEDSDHELVARMIRNWVV